MRMIKWLRLAGVCAIVAYGANAASAAQVTLPDTSNTTTLTANVAEQATISIPATCTFAVNSVLANTNNAAFAVSVTHIVLADTKAVKISVLANSANFTAATGGSVTWSAGDITWGAGSWTGGTGATGTLSTSYAEVVTSDANVATLSTANVPFTLAAKSSVDRAGSHTLVVTWKVESI